MAKLYSVKEHPKEQIKRDKRKYKHRRFFSGLEMSIIKHDEAIHNSEMKRGVAGKGNNNIVYECGCGCRGCFIHRNYTSKNEKTEGVSLLRNIMNKTKPTTRKPIDVENELIMKRNGFDHNSFKK